MECPHRGHRIRLGQPLLHVHKCKHQWSVGARTGVQLQQQRRQQQKRTKLMMRLSNKAKSRLKAPTTRKASQNSPTSSVESDPHNKTTLEVYGSSDYKTLCYKLLEREIQAGRRTVNFTVNKKLSTGLNNCGRNNHTVDQCFAKGGPKHKDKQVTSHAKKPNK